MFKRDEGGRKSCERGTEGVVADRVCLVPSRSGQALCWSSVAEVPLQALKSAAALVLCLCVGGSEQLDHNEWGGSSFLFRTAFSASRK